MVTDGILNNYLTTELFVEQICPTDLELDPRNARTHSKKRIGRIAESIRAFGLVNTVLIDDADRVIAGHGRLAAARLLIAPQGLKRNFRLEGRRKIPSLRHAPRSSANRSDPTYHSCPILGDHLS